MKIIYPNTIGANLLDGVIIAYLKIFTVNSVMVMISLFMIVCLPESWETVLSSLLTCECSKNLLQFMSAEKSQFSFGLSGLPRCQNCFCSDLERVGACGSSWCSRRPGGRGGGVRAGLFWEVQSGQMRVNRHKLLHWKFLCEIRPVLANTKGVEH